MRLGLNFSWSYSGVVFFIVAPGRSTSPMGPEGEIESSEAGTAAVEVVGIGTFASRGTEGAISCGGGGSVRINVGTVNGATPTGGEV